MVSYNSICELCGDEVCREVFGEPNSSPHELSAGAERLDILNEATIDSVQ